MNFVRVCTELIWDFWSLGNEIFSRLWLYCYYKTYTNYSYLSLHAAVSCNVQPNHWYGL